LKSRGLRVIACLLIVTVSVVYNFRVFQKLGQRDSSETTAPEAAINRTPFFAINGNPAIAPIPDSRDQKLLGGATRLTLPLVNAGNLAAHSIRWKMLSIEKDFTGELLNKDKDSTDAVAVGQAFVPSWMLPPIGPDQKARYFVFLVGYRGDSPKETKQEWCYSWPGAVDSRVVVTLFQCDTGESKAIHDALPETAFDLDLPGPAVAPSVIDIKASAPATATPKNSSGNTIIQKGPGPNIAIGGNLNAPLTLNTEPEPAKLRWKQAPSESLWPTEASYGLLVTVFTDKTVSGLHMQFRCDVPIERFQFNIGRLGSMSSDLPTGDPTRKDFTISMPPLTPDIPLTIYIAAKSPIKVIELAAR